MEKPQRAVERLAGKNAISAALIQQQQHGEARQVVVSACFYLQN